jgi:tRNA threonylcarbamoyladenosine biosynthesis protein TsaE
MQISYSLATISQAAYQLWAWKHKYNVWTFSGDMGAGKTTLISALCQVAGSSDAVSSPTFALINEYQLPEGAELQTIYHMDWYRIRSVEEAIHAGIEDHLYRPGALSLVEWPEKASELLYRPYLQLDISLISETERLLTVTEITP